MTRILITGSRAWHDKAAIAKALLDAVNRHPWPITIVHGNQKSRKWDLGAKRYVYFGADYLTDQLARVVGFDVEPHNPDWDRYGKAAGPIRNQEMIDTGIDECLAFPMGKSPGTRDCVRRAEAAGIPVINYGYLEEK